MKKLTLLLLTLCISLSAAHAQEVFAKGKSTLNIGTSLLGTLERSHSIKVPHLSATYDLSVADKLFGNNGSIGIGAYVGHVGLKSTNIGEYSYTSVALRTTLHIDLFQGFDLYIGGLGGYAIKHGSHPLHDSIGIRSQLVWGSFGGARYMFTDHFGAYVEGGYGLYTVNAGITLRF